MEKISFRTKARVVDLLGREQIADASSAITEIFKNSVDAQASNIVAHYHTKESILEFSDNGLGMRASDLRDKWLVLATDSRHSKPDSEYLKYASNEQRKNIDKFSPFGEKGIGRLAVASLGSAVLVWTRWGKGKDLQRTMALVFWDLFKFSQFNLDEIYIPFITLGANDKPYDAALLLNEFFIDWLDENKKQINKNSKSYNSISEIEKLSKIVFNSSLKSVNFPIDSMGTSFYIFDTKDEVAEIFRERREIKGEESSASEGMKTFFGFNNHFSGEKPRIEIKPYIDNKEAFNAADAFWIEEDFKEADYEIDLTIDKNGFAKGTFRRFNEIYKYEYQTKDLPARSDYPGTLDLKVGYVLGKVDETSLSSDRHKYFSDKLAEIGALYVYRDGIRVMPYGRDDQDFLEFEYRRNLRSGTYVFSHRRMFGYVGITSNNNPGLKDKAGREGFIKDKYYRGFKHILTEIFKDIALTYLATKPKEEYAAEQKKKDRPFDLEAKEITKEFLQRYKESKKNLEKIKKKFTLEIESLKVNLSDLKSGNIEKISEYMEKLTRIRERFESDSEELIEDIPNLAQPNGKNLASWDSYLSDKQLFETKTNKQLVEFSKQLDSALKKFSDKYLYLQKLDSRLKKQEERLFLNLEVKKSELLSCLDEIQSKRIPSWLKKHKSDIERIVRNPLGDNPALTVVNGEVEDLEKFERALSDQTKLAKVTIEPYWDSILRDIKRMSAAKSMESAIGDLHRELEGLQERELIYVELAQLGLIVEGIDHEYRVLFKQAKEDFKTLNKSFNQNTFKDLESVFESINEKIESLSPLYRAGKRRYETVTGSEIFLFLKERFKDEFEVGLIQVSKSVLNLVWKNTNRSVLYASLINIINNAKYWIDKSPSNPEIRFTIDPKGLVVSDSGPGIAERDKERIFEAYFSRKPTGRGLGLYLSRTALKFHGMDLVLSEIKMKNALDGANFLIMMPKQDEEG
ncbi:ATP-binding protein [Leptospira limi]|uniref:histidine kinase n=1 Tax=Leptospira limi TaxID=2950023 RepID=A0ABT3M163_9LEPT|nr:ATP-binding protein [Leptospira limi]MCW7463714.1 ATP-binding protein [Leptospira limi]